AMVVLYGILPDHRESDCACDATVGSGVPPTAHRLPAVYYEPHARGTQPTVFRCNNDATGACRKESWSANYGTGLRRDTQSLTVGSEPIDCIAAADRIDSCHCRMFC